MTLIGPLVALLLVTGCGGTGGVDTSLTLASATQSAVHYLEKTLAALPPGVSLSFRSDNPALGEFGLGTVEPCNANDEAGTGPAEFGTYYWLNGVPKGRGRVYFDKIVEIWSGWGWKRLPDSDSGWTVYGSAEGYTLGVQDAGKGEGSLSITAGTPCFPAANKDPHLHQPSRIERPPGS